MITRRHVVYEEARKRLPDGDYKFLEKTVYGIYKSFEAAQSRLQELVQTIQGRDMTGREDVVYIPGMGPIDWEE